MTDGGPSSVGAAGGSGRSSTSISKSISASALLTSVPRFRTPEEDEADDEEQHGPADAPQPLRRVERDGRLLEERLPREVEVDRDRLVRHDGQQRVVVERTDVALDREDHARAVHAEPQEER